MQRDFPWLLTCAGRRAHRLYCAGRFRRHITRVYQSLAPNCSSRDHRLPGEFRGRPWHICSRVLQPFWRCGGKRPLRRRRSGVRDVGWRACRRFIAVAKAKTEAKPKHRTRQEYPADQKNTWQPLDRSLRCRWRFTPVRRCRDGWLGLTHDRWTLRRQAPRKWRHFNGCVFHDSLEISDMPVW